jgi:hypothetical protein
MMLVSRTSCGTSAPPEAQDVEVGLSHFAAIGGMTERQFCQRFFNLLNSGRLMDTLTIAAQAQLQEWIINNGLEDKEFMVSFQLSMNRVVDPMVYCRCVVDMSGDEPKIRILEATPGLSHNPPRNPGLPGFDLGFCDMNPLLGG